LKSVRLKEVAARRSSSGCYSTRIHPGESRRSSVSKAKGWGKDDNLRFTLRNGLEQEVTAPEGDLLCRLAGQGHTIRPHFESLWVDLQVGHGSV